MNEDRQPAPLANAKSARESNQRDGGHFCFTRGAVVTCLCEPCRQASGKVFRLKGIQNERGEFKVAGIATTTEVNGDGKGYGEGR
jgi:hypothetical protein